jgi:Zn-dependent protease with chaperone function
VSFEWRLAVVALAAFAASGLAGAACVPWLWRRLAVPTPAAQASALLQLRLLPAGLAAAGASLAAASYLLFEPRMANESAGVVLVVFAALATGLAAGALARSARLAYATRRALRAWLASSQRVTLPGVTVPVFAVTAPFPVVAVVGVWRPRLIVARSVLAACAPDELAAIAAHEQGHIVRRDNLGRAAFLLAPDIAAWLPLSSRLLSAWRDAAEEAADDFAGGDSATARVTLAQALIKVARLAPAGTAPAALPASALYRGENLDRRIRRLLAAPSEQGRPARPRWPRGAVALMTLAVCGLALGGVQAILELAVNFLP